jgi:hypothetical protein
MSYSDVDDLERVIDDCELKWMIFCSTHNINKDVIFSGHKLTYYRKLFNYAIGQYTSNGSNTYATVGDSANQIGSADRRSIYAPLILNPNKFTSFYLPRVSLTTITGSNYFEVRYFLPENNSLSGYSYNPPKGSSNLRLETSAVSYLVAPVITYVKSTYYYYDGTLGDGLCYSQTNTAGAESVSLDYALSMDGRIYFKDIDYVVDSEVPGTRPTIQGKAKIDFKKFII